MGEHQTWFDLLRHNDWWRDTYNKLQAMLGIDTVPVTGEHSHFTLNHVFAALLVVLFILFGARAFKKAMSKGDEALIPPAKWNLRLVFETICDGVLGLMVGVFGTEEKARKYFPFMASLFTFILFNNFMALLPGFGLATDTLKTNLMLGLVVFVATHYWGVREHGIVAYLKHFMGPVWWLAPLFFIIEMISHLARPMSLALRLLGNMAADHKVLFTFFFLVPVLVPVPFYFLGILVCVVQALVFSLLSMVYVSMAVAHDH